MPKRIRLLIIDDSALAREVLSQGLAQDPEIEVVGTAVDPYDARDKIARLRPEVLTLDIEMPRMDGLDFLRRLMAQFPLPVIMVSGLTETGKAKTLEALAAGAVDFVTKPQADVTRRLGAMLTELRSKIKLAATVDVSQWARKRAVRRTVVRTPTAAATYDQLIVIGASTGGTEAVRELLTHFPAAMPPVLVVLHFPPGFTSLFADRMDALCEMKVKEAQDGDCPVEGLVLVAPGGRHMRLAGKHGNYHVTVTGGEPVNGVIPSVDVLMHSVAQSAESHAIGIILTGMGRDGAEGLKAMRLAGARCLAQDEATSVVFGMPKEAYANGAAERLVPLGDIAPVVIDWVREKT